MPEIVPPAPMGELLGFQRIFGRDAMSGHVQIARLNALAEAGVNYVPASEFSRIRKFVLFGIGCLAAAGALSAAIVGVHAFAARPTSSAFASLPPMYFSTLVQGAISAGHSAQTAHVMDILSPAAAGKDDDIVSAYKALAAGKTAPSTRAMPKSGPFPGDAIAYRLVTVGGEQVMFVGVLVSGGDYASDSLWLGVVHRTRAGIVEVCNFIPEELARYKGLVRAPQARCTVSESMIPRATLAAFN